jgi:hypothetical protein
MIAAAVLFSPGWAEWGCHERSDQKINRLDNVHEDVSELVRTWRF